MAQKQYSVIGMSCERCAATIREGVSEVLGMSEAVVDVGRKPVTVHGVDRDHGRLREAIVQAGFGVGDPVAARVLEEAGLDTMIRHRLHGRRDPLLHRPE